jgi:hypothetical protein
LLNRRAPAQVPAGIGPGIRLGNGKHYSDAEESDAGYQFAASGTATDYTEKTLLVKTGRGTGQ